MTNERKVELFEATMDWASQHSDEFVAYMCKAIGMTKEEATEVFLIEAK